MRRNEEFLGVN